MKSDAREYLTALIANYHKADEISIGLSLGFTERSTQAIIRELLEQGKIEFATLGICSYKPALVQVLQLS